LISVILPVFNGQRFLEEALGSVRDQAHENLEVLLIDDGSTDPPVIPEKFTLPIRCIRQNHRGQAAARNRGIREARGEVLAFLDVDDRWTAGHLDRLQSALTRHPDAGIAQGRMRHFTIEDDGTEYRSGPYRMPYMGASLVRRWVFDRCGVFDESMTFGEDYDWMFRCWEQEVPKCVVEEVSLMYRRHPGNMTSGKATESHMPILKRRIERIRSGVVDPSRPHSVRFQDYIGETEKALQWTRWSA
jgi:glycosyltransferase involved in cell wall biosynthesis